MVKILHTQTNSAATRAANSYSYSHLAIQPMDKAVIDAQKEVFQEIFYFARYRDGCKTVWRKDVRKINLLFDFLHPLDEDLKLVIKIGGQTLYFLEMKTTFDKKRLNIRLQ